LSFAASITHDRGNYEERLRPSVSNLALDMTIRPMYAWPGASGPFNAMLGATPDAPVDGMFSFVPCLPITRAGLRGFPRLAIESHAAINPGNPQAVSFNKDIKPEEFPQLWRELVHAATGSGLALATRLDLPASAVLGSAPA
jgi:hypothetical protein